MPIISKEKGLQVKDVMTKNPICCTPETNLREVAQLMMERDCGEIPVVDSEKTMNLVGVITDRDITCRTVALGKNPLEMTAGECLSSPSVNVTPETSLEECCKTMESYGVFRWWTKPAAVAASSLKPILQEMLQRKKQARW